MACHSSPSATPCPTGLLALLQGAPLRPGSGVSLPKGLPLSLQGTLIHLVSRLFWPASHPYTFWFAKQGLPHSHHTSGSEDRAQRQDTSCANGFAPGLLASPKPAQRSPSTPGLQRELKLLLGNPLAGDAVLRIHDEMQISMFKRATSSMVHGKGFQLVKCRVLNKFQTKNISWQVPQHFRLMVSEVLFFFFQSCVP